MALNSSRIECRLQKNCKECSCDQLWLRFLSKSANHPKICDAVIRIIFFLHYLCKIARSAERNSHRNCDENSSNYCNTNFQFKFNILIKINGLQK